MGAKKYNIYYDGNEVIEEEVSNGYWVKASDYDEEVITNEKAIDLVIDQYDNRLGIIMKERDTLLIKNKELKLAIKTIAKLP